MLLAYIQAEAASIHEKENKGSRQNERRDYLEEEGLLTVKWAVADRKRGEHRVKWQLALNKASC